MATEIVGSHYDDDDFNISISPMASSSQMNMSEVPLNETDNCAYEPPPYLIERFWLVSVFGTSVAVISILENVFLFFMLARNRQHRNSHCLYLILLAFCDIFIALAYIPLMSFSLLLDYFESVTLLRAWYFYMVPMITISHVAISASSFLICAASFERYTITKNSKLVRKLHKYRKLIGAGVILAGFLAKFSLAFEFKIDVNEACIGTMNEYSLSLSSVATNYWYNLLWRLWFRSILTVLAPFLFLSIINIRIVMVLRKSDFVQLLHLEKISEVQRKSRVRAATRTLVLLVMTYLMANVLNVILTIWEYIEMNSLMSMYAFYTFSVDSISILTILAGAFRLPIYVTSQPQLRNEFRDYFKKIIVKDNMKEDMSSDSSNSPYAPMLVRITEMLLSYPSNKTKCSSNLNKPKYFDDESISESDADAEIEVLNNLSDAASASTHPISENEFTNAFSANDLHNGFGIGNPNGGFVFKQDGREVFL
uniref:G_PROTEIN_RECEP_F1_2 domain-containing protein n=1 Tax=Panagrellus redivivus TaxID=6233 RepID=A0A7E4ZRN2_PANRE